MQIFVEIVYDEYWSPENASGDSKFWLPSSAEEVKFQL